MHTPASPASPSAQARYHQWHLQQAVTSLGYAITTGRAPSPADITAARNALEALIQLAGGKSQEELDMDAEEQAWADAHNDSPGA